MPLLIGIGALLVGGVAAAIVLLRSDSSPKPTAAPATIVKTVIQEQTITTPQPEAPGGTLPSNDGSGQTPSPSPAPQTSSWPTGNAGAVYFNYPPSWNFETDGAWKTSYYDTTLRSGGDPNVKLRIDQTPNSGTDAAGAARGVEAYLRRSPSYTNLGMTSTTLAGHDAVRWEFTVRDSSSGPLMHKVDTFFTDRSGDGYAVLVQAPESRWNQLQPSFNRILQSVAPAGE